MTGQQDIINRLQQENICLKATIVELQLEIRQRCHNYLVHLQSTPRHTLHSHSRTVSPPSISNPIKPSDTFLQPLKATLTESRNSSFLYDSTISEPEELLKLQDELEFLRRLQEQQQSNHPSRESKEESRVKELESEVRKFEERVYVFQSIFSSIYDLVGEGEKPQEEINFNKYDRLEEQLRGLFTKIKAMKRMAKLAEKDKKTLMRQLKTIHVKAVHVLSKQPLEILPENSHSSPNCSSRNCEEEQSLLSGLVKQLQFLESDIAPRRNDLLRSSMSTVTEVTGQQRLSVYSLEEIDTQMQRRSCQENRN